MRRYSVSLMTNTLLHSILQILRLRPLVFIFLLALSLRLAAFAVSGPSHSSYAERLLCFGDPFEYVTLARSLHERAAFSVTWPEPMPNAFRTPGYPILIMLICQGRIEFLWAFVLVQVLIDSIFATALAWVVQVCFASRRVALVSGVLYAVCPEGVFWSTQLFPETAGLWFTVSGIGLLAASINSAHNTKQRAAFLRYCGCLLLGCSVLIKPNWLLLPPIVGLWLVFHLRGSGFGSTFKMLAACFILLALPGFSWMGWNKLHWGNWTINYGQTAFKESLSASVIRKTGSLTAPASSVWSREMNLHLLIPDFSQPNFLPESHRNVTEWSSSALATDKAFTDAQYTSVTLNNFPSYLSIHGQGLLYLLASPGSDFIARAFGLSDPNTGIYANFASSNASLFELVRTKLFSTENALLRVAITALVLSFVALILIGSLIQLITEIKSGKVFTTGGPWVSYLVYSFLLIAIIGAGGTFRYRYAILVAFIPYAAAFISSKPSSRCYTYIINKLALRRFEWVRA